MQGQNEGQFEEALRPAAQAHGPIESLAEAVGPRAQAVRAPRVEGSRHESTDADVQHNMMLARRPGEGEASQGALVQGTLNDDTTIIRAEFHSMLGQVEKTLQGHGNQITTWRLEEEHGIFLMQACHGRHNRMCNKQFSTGQQEVTMNVDDPRRSTTAEGPSQTQSAVQASGAEGGQFLGKLKYMKKLRLFPRNKLALGQEQRSWQEWQGEFTQNAKL